MSGRRYSSIYLGGSPHYDPLSDFRAVRVSNFPRLVKPPSLNCLLPLGARRDREFQLVTQQQSLLEQSGDDFKGEMHRRMIQVEMDYRATLSMFSDTT